MDRRGSKSEANETFSAWLRTQRERHGQSIEDIARVTRIGQRTLERLEGGRFDELPADVFVRGFIRNYARCVGIDPDEALARYGDVGVAPAPVASMEAQALLETMAALAPKTLSESAHGVGRAVPLAQPRVLRARSSGIQPAVAEPAVSESVPVPVPLPESESIVAPIEVAEAVAQAPSKNKRRRNARVADGSIAPENAPNSKSRRRRSRKNKPQVASQEHAQPAVEQPTPQQPVQPEELEVEIEIVATPAPMIPAPIHVSPHFNPSAFASGGAARVVRRAPTVAPPSLVIDDDDPERAERAREAREENKEPSRRSFLPPILLDEERSGRQGGLTLAVIILLIVATLTLSYLMRRPGSSSEGVTAREVPAQLVG